MRVVGGGKYRWAVAVTISRDFISQLATDMRGFGMAGGTAERRRDLRGQVADLGRYIAGTGRTDLMKLMAQAESAPDKYVDVPLNEIASILFNEGRSSI